MQYLTRYPQEILSSYYLEKSHAKTNGDQATERIYKPSQVTILELEILCQKIKNKKNRALKYTLAKPFYAPNFEL